MNNRIQKSTMKGCVVFALLVVLFGSCQYTPVSDDRDLLELERVWQFMSAFSIYQERIPTEEAALQFSNPQALMRSILDTLYDWKSNKTYYIGDYLEDGQGFLSQSFITPKLSQEAVKSETFFRKLTNSTAYLHINTFLSRTVHQTVQSYLPSMDGVSNLILDLRGNGGGYIDVCVEIIEAFLTSNTSYLIVKERKSAGSGMYVTDSTSWTTIKADNSGGWEAKKIVILTDNGTASASEILAVALRDGRPVGSVSILGEKSFGKGIGQYVFIFSSSSGGGVSITGFRFWRINGGDYHEQGIPPDVPMTGSFRNQLLEAGKMLETNFEANLDTNAFNDVLNQPTTTTPPHHGIYKIFFE